MPFYTRDNLPWESYDGRKTLIKDLNVRHLVNILNHTKQTNDESVKTVYPIEVVQLLEAEAELRIMAGWAKNIGIPRRNDDGSWELINQTANEKAIEDAKTQLHQEAMKRQCIKNQRLTPVELLWQTHKIQQLTLPEICK